MPQSDATLSFFDSFVKDNPTIKFIRYQWIDYAGILGIRILPVSHCRHLLEPGSALQITSVTITSSTIVESMSDLVSFGCDVLIPDLRSCDGAVNLSADRPIRLNLETRVCRVPALQHDLVRRMSNDAVSSAQ